MEAVHDVPAASNLVPRIASWVTLALGGLLGSFMSSVVLQTLVEDFTHPNLGWGAMGLIFVQPFALLLSVPSAIAVVMLAPAAQRRFALGIATAVVLWVAFAMVGLTFHNSGC
jgi:hypothetical protein